MPASKLFLFLFLQNDIHISNDGSGYILLGSKDKELL
jgi:hypothetical protein